jgi:adenylate kinase family enzyme
VSDRVPRSPPQRISIQGVSGSGKSTLGRALEQRMGIPHLETDALVHGPGWSETPDSQLRALVEPLVLSERWVIDSDYRRKLGTLVLQHADTVVWLDLPLRVCLRRLWARTRRRIRGREQIWNGNTESWWTAFGGRNSLFGYAIRSHFSSRRSMPELLARPELAHLQLVRLRSRDEVDRWLAQVAAETDGAEDRPREAGDQATL